MASCRPRPRLAPVTSAVFPVISMMFSPFGFGHGRSQSPRQVRVAYFGGAHDCLLLLGLRSRQSGRRRFGSARWQILIALLIAASGPGRSGAESAEMVAGYEAETQAATWVREVKPSLVSMCS